MDELERRLAVLQDAIALGEELSVERTPELLCILGAQDDERDAIEPSVATWARGLSWSASAASVPGRIITVSNSWSSFGERGTVTWRSAARAGGSHV